MHIAERVVIVSMLDTCKPAKYNFYCLY